MGNALVARSFASGAEGEERQAGGVAKGAVEAGQQIPASRVTGNRGNERPGPGCP